NENEKNNEGNKTSYRILSENKEKEGDGDSDSEKNDSERNDNDKNENEKNNEGNKTKNKEKEGDGDSDSERNDSERNDNDKNENDKNNEGNKTSYRILSEIEEWKEGLDDDKKKEEGKKDAKSLYTLTKGSKGLVSSKDNIEEIKNNSNEEKKNKKKRSWVLIGNNSELKGGKNGKDEKENGEDEKQEIETASDRKNGKEKKYTNEYIDEEELEEEEEEEREEEKEKYKDMDKCKDNEKFKDNEKYREKEKYKEKDKYNEEEEEEEYDDEEDGDVKEMRKKEIYKCNYYTCDILETVASVNVKSDGDKYDAFSLGNRHPERRLDERINRSDDPDRCLTYNYLFNERESLFRKGNYYFINPGPYNIIKMKQNKGMFYSKSSYDYMNCYSSSFNEKSTLADTADDSKKRLKQIEEIIPGCLTGFKSDDGYQKLLTPMFVQNDIFLHCAFKNDASSEVNDKHESFPIKIYLKKNLDKTKGCSFQINEGSNKAYKEYALRESFLSNKIILNDINTGNDCIVHASDEIVGFQCGPPYRFQRKDNIILEDYSVTTNTREKYMIREERNEDFGFFKTEPFNCFEYVNDNEPAEDVVPGSIVFPTSSILKGQIHTNHTRYIKLSKQSENKIVSCSCNYYSANKLLYIGRIIIKVQKSNSVHLNSPIGLTKDMRNFSAERKKKFNYDSKLDTEQFYNNGHNFFNNYYIRGSTLSDTGRDMNSMTHQGERSKLEVLSQLNRIMDKMRVGNFYKKKKSISGHYDHDDEYDHSDSELDGDDYGKWDSQWGIHWDSQWYKPSDSQWYKPSDSQWDRLWDNQWYRPSGRQWYRPLDSQWDRYSDRQWDENWGNQWDNHGGIDVRSDLLMDYDENTENEHVSSKYKSLKNAMDIQDSILQAGKSQNIALINRSKNVKVVLPKYEEKYNKYYEEMIHPKFISLIYEEKPNVNEQINKSLKLFKEYYPPMLGETTSEEDIEEERGDVDTLDKGKKYTEYKKWRDEEKLKWGSDGENILKAKKEKKWWDERKKKWMTDDEMKLMTGAEKKWWDQKKKNWDTDEDKEWETDEEKEWVTDDEQEEEAFHKRNDVSYAEVTGEEVNKMGKGKYKKKKKKKEEEKSEEGGKKRWGGMNGEHKYGKKDEANDQINKEEIVEKQREVGDEEKAAEGEEIGSKQKSEKKRKRGKKKRMTKKQKREWVKEDKTNKWNNEKMKEEKRDEWKNENMKEEKTNEWENENKTNE
ncbi:6-cysteine protein (LISP2), partial [Plasmodium malariae]